MRKSIFQYRVSFNDFLIVLLFVVVIIFPNASTISRIGKVVFGTLGLLYTLNRRHIFWFYYIGWIFAICILAIVSVSWAMSKEYAADGSQTIILNGICAFLFIQLNSANLEWKKTVYRCCAFFPILRFSSLFFTFGTEIFRGLRALGQDATYNAIGFFGALGVAFCILLLKRESRSNRIWRVVLVLDLLICIISMSRKAVIYLIVPIIFYYLFTGTNIAKKLKRFLFLIIIVAGVWIAIMNIPILYTYIGSGLESILNFFESYSGDASAVGRNIRISYGLQWFAERPMLGYGARNFNYMFAPLWKSSAMVVADNNFIDVLVSFGIVGFCIYYSLHLCTLVKVIKKRKYMDDDMVMLLGVFLALLICDYGVSSYIYLHSQIYLAVAVYGICEAKKFSGLNVKRLVF